MAQIVLSHRGGYGRKYDLGILKDALQRENMSSHD